MLFTPINFILLKPIPINSLHKTPQIFDDIYIFLTKLPNNLAETAMKCKTCRFLIVITLVLNYWRLLTRYYAQNFDDSVLHMNEHLTKDAPHETLFKPDDPWLANEKVTYQIYLNT